MQMTCCSTQTKETVRDAILNAPPIPLHGLNDIEHYTDEFQSLYEQGVPSGVSTGFPSVDELFTVQTGMLYVVSGHAGEGKSCFLDQLIVQCWKKLRMEDMLLFFRETSFTAFGSACANPHR